MPWARDRGDARSRPPGIRHRSVGARGLPEVDAALDGVLVDRVELLLREVEVVERAEAVLELTDRRGADEHRRDALVAQDPRERHLRERLAARLRHLVEGADVREVLLGQQVGRERLACDAREPSGTPFRYLSVSMPCASGLKAMQPTPSSPTTSSRSSSTQRLSIE